MGGSAVVTSLNSSPCVTPPSPSTFYSLSGIRLTAQHAGPRIKVSRSDDGTILSRRIVMK